MVYCSAVGCNNDSRYVGRKQGVSYHRFPTDDKLLKEWLAKLSRLDLVVTKDSRVCSFHFEPECYERDLKAELLGLKSTKKLFEARCSANNFRPPSEKEAETII